MSLARTRIAARLVAAAALAALTAGCFQPMYAEHADGTPGLRDKLMTVDLPPGHKLILRFNTTRSSLMVSQTTGLPTSETYGIDAQYNLVEIATDKSVMT